MANAITTARVIRGFDLARSKVFLKKLKNKPRSGGKVRVNYCIEKYRSLIGRQENQCKCSVVSRAWYTGETQKRPLLPLQFVCHTEARMIFLKSKYDTSLLLLKILGWLLFRSATQMVIPFTAFRHWKRTRLGENELSFGHTGFKMPLRHADGDVKKWIRFTDRKVWLEMCRY